MNHLSGKAILAKDVYVKMEMIGNIATGNTKFDESVVICPVITK